LEPSAAAVSEAAAPAAAVTGEGPGGEWTAGASVEGGGGFVEGEAVEGLLGGEDAASHLYEVGTFAQVHTILSGDTTDSAQLLLLGHRRLRREATVGAGLVWSGGGVWFFVVVMRGKLGTRGETFGLPVLATVTAYTPPPIRQPNPYRQLSSDPLSVSVTHLKDEPYANDDITKATSMVRTSRPLASLVAWGRL
jgi:hypothetical protein